MHFIRTSWVWERNKMYRISRGDEKVWDISKISMRLHCDFQGFQNRYFNICKFPVSTLWNYNDTKSIFMKNVRKFIKYSMFYPRQSIQELRFQFFEDASNTCFLQTICLSEWISFVSSHELIYTKTTPSGASKRSWMLQSSEKKML